MNAKQATKYDRLIKEAIVHCIDGIQKQLGCDLVKGMHAKRPIKANPFSTTIGLLDKLLDMESLTPRQRHTLESARRTLDNHAIDRDAVMRRINELQYIINDYGKTRETTTNKNRLKHRKAETDIEQALWITGKWENFQRLQRDGKISKLEKVRNDSVERFRLWLLDEHNAKKNEASTKLPDKTLNDEVLFASEWRRLREIVRRHNSG
jgi:hypothetical protein